MAINPIKRLAGETAIYGLGTIVPRLLNYFLVPFYTRIFDQNAYGQITELYAWVAIIMVILTYGMETAFFRYANKEKDPKRVFNTATTSLFFTSIVFVLVIIIFLQDISTAIRYEGNSEYIMILAVIVALDAFTSLPFAYLRFRNKARRFSFIKITGVLVNIFLNFLLLLVIPKYFGERTQELIFYRNENLIVFVFIANLLSSLTTLLLLIPELKLFRLIIDKQLLRKMLAYGLPILIIGMAGMINEVSDKILLKYLLPANVDAQAQIGVYGANYKLAILMTLFIQMFRYAAEPFFFAESGKKDAKATYSRVMTYFVLFTLLIFLGVTMFIDVFKYFIGPKFWAGLMIVPIVLAAKLFLGVFYNLSVWYKLTNKTLYGAVIALTGAAVTIVLNIVLIPKYGYLGSAWANFFCYLSMMIISYFWGRRIYPIKYQLKKIAAYTLLAGFIYYISRAVTIENNYLAFLFHTVLLLSFAGLIIVREKRYLATQKAD
ncbi:MAG: lipopolysaccharide biosynthesis protein [Bacteroidetes bacterium]|nr:MAG: lipopolysaccharide biosynthesis protein [Bacteroidota bacterium]RLD86300.1 MAG: lipopolysaccharide biosynthesis protein [Bacteroidota bacterium]